MDVTIDMKKEEFGIVNIVVPDTNVKVEASMLGGQLCISVYNDKVERVYKLIENKTGGFEILDQYIFIPEPR